MFKKFVSIITVFAVLLAFTPVVAADTAPATPTVESILTDYHEKAFAAQVSSDTDATAYSSRSVGATLTLEQETVNELTAAGYDAYNVTGDNYDIVGEELNTDLASLGITDDGSYIVVISGEDSASESSSGRAIVPQPGDGGGGTNSPFVYSYEGVNYTMRYVTVADADSNLGGFEEWIDLLEETNSNSALDLVDTIMTITSVFSFAINYATSFIYNAFSSFLDVVQITLPDIHPTKQTELLYKPATAWTVTYAQILNGSTWMTCSSVEYVITSYTLHFGYFDRSENCYLTKSANRVCEPVYSHHYNDTAWLKEFAVLSYTNGIMNYCEQDRVNRVEHKLGDQIIFIKERWDENFSQIPELNS